MGLDVEEPNLHLFLKPQIPKTRGAFLDGPEIGEKGAPIAANVPICARSRPFSSSTKIPYDRAIDETYASGKSVTESNSVVENP